MTQYFKIPIVLASDENYASQMYVTILSAIENKNKNNFYDFYLLVPKGFQEKIKIQFYELTEKYLFCNITFIEIDGDLTNKKTSIRHITSPTYYRLKMPTLLSNYEKAIYLDVDTIILQDLAEYFNTDIENNYIAGVKAADYMFFYNTKKDYFDRIGITDISNYINAGVTLWNLKKIREDSLSEELCKMINNNYSSMDQDIINVVFFKKIKVLPLKYNLMTKYTGLFKDTLPQYKALSNIYKAEEIKEAVENPVIIHYADKVKPWNDKEMILAEYWWKYALKSPFEFKSDSRLSKKIFSVKNNKYKTHKVITFFGVSIEIQRDLIKKILSLRNDKNKKILTILGYELKIKRKRS